MGLYGNEALKGLEGLGIVNEVRNELFFIVDFNLENSYNMTYNEIASLPGDDPRKIFYVFTSENNDKYYELYKNNKLGQLILRRMEYMVENFDAIFYYDKDKFNEQVAKEVGFEEGKMKELPLVWTKVKLRRKKK